MSNPADPVPPLLVAEGLDLMFFRSQESLSGYVETWFPTDVDYQAWDSRGRRLELLVQSEAEPLTGARRRRAARERVVARISDERPHGQELRDYLTRWLDQIGAPRPAPHAPLSELLHHAISRGDLH